MSNITNIGSLIKSSGMSNISSRVRSIGRGLGNTSEALGEKVGKIGRSVNETVDDMAPMIGLNIARSNLGLFAGLGGAIGGTTLFTKFSGWLKNQDTGSGIIGNNSSGRRFGSLVSNSGYNHIEGFNKK